MVRQVDKISRNEDMIHIGFLGFILGMLLLAVPVYVLAACNVQLGRQTVASVARMMAGVGVTALFAYYLSHVDKWWVNALFFVLLTAASTAFTLGGARLKKRRYWVPVASGLFASVLLVGAWFEVLVLGQHSLFDARTFIPVSALLMGQAVSCCSAALHTYYAGLDHHRRLYEYLLGNGATHNQAVGFFMKRALQQTLLPSLKSMSELMAGAAPVMMWTLMLGGTGAVSAALFEVLLWIAALAASVLALVVTIVVGRRYAFDEYDRLKK